MPPQSKIRVGILVAALFSLGGSVLAAADTRTPPDPSILYMRPPGASDPLIPSTTGQLVVPGSPAGPRRMALGINDLGAQLRLHLNPDWAAEVRYLRGTASSDVGTIDANVFGVRGYRFFSEHHHFQLYAGLEAAYVSTSIRSYNNSNPPTSVANVSGFGDTSGYATGGFGGVEYRLGRRVAIDLDIGPYMIGLQEKVTSVSDASLDFVLDTAINVYLF